MNEVNNLSEAAGTMSGFLGSPVLAVFCLLGVFLIASIGAIAGMITRNVAILIGVAVAFALFFAFHWHLPLPTDVHLQMDAALQRIGL